MTANERITQQILRRVHINIVAVEKQQVLNILFFQRACTWMSKCVRACVCVRVGVDARTRAYSCARVAMLIWHATRHHIVFCGLSGSTIVFDIIS